MSYFLAAAAIVLLFGASPSSAANEEEGVRVNPHDYGKKGNCSYCHMEEPPKLNFDPVTTCTKCHPGNVSDHPVSRHPIGKKARIQIPGDLPVTKEGLMVCYTCHDQHNKSKYPKMLRTEPARLCSSCHVGY